MVTSAFCAPALSNASRTRTAVHDTFRVNLVERLGGGRQGGGHSGRRAAVEVEVTREEEDGASKVGPRPTVKQPVVQMTPKVANRGKRDHTSTMLGNCDERFGSVTLFSTSRPVSSNNPSLLCKAVHQRHHAILVMVTALVKSSTVVKRTDRPHLSMMHDFTALTNFPTLIAANTVKPFQNLADVCTTWP